MDAGAVAIALAESRALSRRVRVRVDQINERVAAHRVWVQHEKSSVAARNRLLCVHEKLDDGLLPFCRPAVVLGRPGSGEQCDACKCVLTPTQLVMAIPAGNDKTVHLDADCYQIWEALRRYYPRTI